MNENEYELKLSQRIVRAKAGSGKYTLSALIPLVRTSHMAPVYLLGVLGSQFSLCAL